jgi:hypothetical protein
MNAFNSGVTPESGFTYANSLLFYARDEEVGINGEVTATGQNAALMDLNNLVWVSKKEILGGAKFSLVATLIISDSSLTSDVNGPINGAGGFGNFFFQPFILGWQKNRVELRAAYGVLAPTGRFTAGANNNVGDGYWTQAPSGAQTFYLTQDKRTAVSAFEMYEINGTQQGTNIHPGQTFDLDYSLTQTFTPREDMRLQLGLVGYGQYQTTDKTGSTVTPAQAAAHYKVNALGFGAGLNFPKRKASLGFKYFKEFENRSTFQGYSVQISGAMTF